MKKLTVFLLIFLVSLSAYAEKSKTTGNGKKAVTGVINSQNAAYLALAKTLIDQQRYADAAQAYRDYLAVTPDADQQYYTEVIELLLRDEKPVEMKNMGSNVNSSVGDYFPRITPDGRTLYFTSYDRPGGYGGEDTWISRKDGAGNWSKAENFGATFNTETHEDFLAISNDGSFAICFGNYVGSFGGGDFFYTVKRGDRWTLPCNLGGSINTKNWETQANLGPDNKTLLFISDRPGGIGGSDIWISFLTENGWTLPKNLGSTVNSSGDERYPFLAADGKTLYFASSGHPGLGGFDIFVSRRLGDGWTDWSKPVNMGKYINTTGDDQDLNVPASGDIALIVKDIAGGYGNSDIYYFSLPDDMRPEKVLSVYGKVTDEDGMPVAAIIHYYDKATGQEVSSAVSNSKDGMYSITLPYGKEYIISIDMKGFLFLSDALDGKDKTVESVKKDYSLQRIKVGLKFELKNIYFESGKATLKEESKAELDKLVAIMNRTAITIELGGHTDNVGSDESNLKLSQDRVDAVKAYLVSKGIPTDRIKAVGYGEKVPIASNDTDEGKAKNRRVEVKVTEIVAEKQGGEVVTEKAPVKQKEEAKFDVLAALRYAAEVGGLPEGSPCTNEAYYYKDRPLVVKYRDDGTIISNYNEYIYGGFNAHLLNYGFKNGDGGFLGAGLNLVDDERTEYHAEYYFSAPKGVKWMAGAGYLDVMEFYDWFGIDLNFAWGIDVNAYNLDNANLSSKDALKLFGTVPLGVRYVHNIAGFALSGDFMYNLGIFKSDNLPSASYTRIGINAKWGMFQGGVFLNSGDLTDYFGFRLGVAF